MKLSVQHIAEIRVHADSTILASGRPAYWQTLLLLDKEGRELGRVVLHLDAPGVALPVGDQPPYWGIDPSQPLALVDGKAPF